MYTAGDRIGDRYVLVRPLGVGGMGVVWVAYSEALQVNVAIKLLHRSLAGTDAVDRMQREARVTAQIGDRAMVRILDFGHHQETPFLVMELLRGESLRETLERKHGLSAVRALRTLLPVARTLALAHEAGIVHRDIKPANIFVSLDGGDRAQPKLLDFGVAKLSERSQARKLTARGTLLGSPAYMSPEQAAGLEVDARSDVWSFCVTLYESVTGDYPFHGETREELLHAINEHSPMPLDEWGVNDEALWHIIEKGLRRDSDARYQSMWELGLVLAEYLLVRGVEHDVTRTSLRGTWTRDTAESHSIPPAERKTARPPGTVNYGAKVRLLYGQATTQAARGFRRWLVPLAGVTVTLAAAALVLLLTARRDVRVETYSVTVPRSSSPKIVAPSRDDAMKPKTETATTSPASVEEAATRTKPETAPPETEAQPKSKQRARAGKRDFGF